MPVRKAITEKEGVYFITFTCTNWLQVIDMYGRIIEVRNVSAEQTIKLGDRYRAGTYIVKFIQGENHKQLKLVKISN